MSDKKIDDVTGVETTSHVWDEDIRELDNPLPRWWLYTFYACILWSFGFWVCSTGLMPDRMNRVDA